MSYRSGLRTRRYVIVGNAGSSTYKLVGVDGEVITAENTAVTDYQQPVTGAWTQAGALLASSMGSDVSEAMRVSLIDQALQRATDVPGRRGLLMDAARLHRDDIGSQLDLTATEVAWTRAVTAFGRGHVATAAAMLLELPEGTYPARILIWYAATDQGRLSIELRDEVHPQLERLAGYGPVHAAAVTLAQQALDGARAGTEGELLQHAREASFSGLDAAPWAQAVSDESLARHTSPPGRLLAARGGDQEALDGSFPIIDGVHPAVLDDLIDAGAIPTGWLDGDQDGVDYLRARIAPDRLSDEALQRYGLDEERARRAVLAGRPQPDDLDDAAAARFEIWRSTDSDDPEEAVRALVKALQGTQPSLADRLLLLLDEPGRVPSDDLLDNAEVSSVLLRTWRLTDDGLRPEALSARQRDFVAVQLLARAKEELFAWRWDAALETSREALRFGRAEAIRDEALSLMGCAHWELGNDDAAIQALRSALDGAYTESLQTNIAVVAAELEPWTAGEYLARLVVEAPDLPLRLSAARKAVEIWSHSTVPWEDEDTYDLPPALAKGLRSLVADKIPLDDFRALARVLAEHDAEWLANERHLWGSPHRDTVEARIWVAKAKGMDTFVAGLAAELRRSTCPQWILSERDRIVALATDILVTDEPPPGAVGFGMVVLDHDLPMDADDLAVLRAFVARAAALTIDPSQGEPNEKFIDWLEQAVREQSRVPAAMKERAEGAIALGFAALAGSYLQARWGMLEQAAGHYDEMVDRLQSMPSYQVNWGAVREAVYPVIELCGETYGLFLRLRPHLSHELVGHVDDLLEFSNRLHAAATQLTNH